MRIQTSFRNSSQCFYITSTAMSTLYIGNSMKFRSSLLCPWQETFLHSCKNYQLPTHYGALKILTVTAIHLKSYFPSNYNKSIKCNSTDINAISPLQNPEHKPCQLPKLSRSVINMVRPWKYCNCNQRNVT
jgi:hypothetical protein